MLREKQSHRVQLQRIIEDLADGIIILAIDGTITWANAAALQMHGDTTRDDLGENVEEYEQRFALSYRDGHELAPDEYPAVRTLAGEELNDVVVEVRRRDGGDQRWVHRVRSLILHDEKKRASFCVLVLVDATREFSAEERFERAFNANPAPALICRRADLRYIKVNRGFLEMTGYDREAVVGCSIYEIDVLEGTDGRDAAIRNLEAGQTIPQMETELRLARGGSKLAVVAGQPIEVGGESCMLFTFIDLEDRRQAHNALKQSEERFAVAFRLAPVPMLITSHDRRILDANEAFVSLFGHERSVAVGRSKTDLKMWGDAETQAAVERQLRESDRVETIEVRLHTAAGMPLDCLLTSEGVSILERRCVLTVIQDVSQRRRSQAQLSEAVKTVMQDSSWLGQKIVARVNSLMDADGDRRGDPDDDKGLSRREREVLALVSQGKSDKAIADLLKISGNTVKNHISAIYRKVGLSKRAEAVVWARQHGIEDHLHERKMKKKD